MSGRCKATVYEGLVVRYHNSLPFTRRGRGIRQSRGQWLPQNTRLRPKSVSIIEVRGIDDRPSTPIFLSLMTVRRLDTDNKGFLDGTSPLHLPPPPRALSQLRRRRSLILVLSIVTVILSASQPLSTLTALSFATWVPLLRLYSMQGVKECYGHLNAVTT